MKYSDLSYTIVILCIIALALIIYLGWHEHTKKSNNYIRFLENINSHVDMSSLDENDRFAISKQLEKLTYDNKIHTLTKSCIKGIANGCLTGAVAGGMEGSIVGGLVFGIIAPIMSGFEYLL